MINLRGLGNDAVIVNFMQLFLKYLDSLWKNTKNISHDNRFTATDSKWESPKDKAEFFQLEITRGLRSSGMLRDVSW